MPRIGLKLWSTNVDYIPLARELYAQKMFQYIELFTVPGSLNMLPRWKELDIPYVLHAPHSYAGLNTADPSKRDVNMALVQEVDSFFSALTPSWVIFHPGVSGDITESIRQLRSFGDRFPDMYQKVVIENKPKIGLQGEACLGASPEEIRRVLDETGRYFCLDFGHAICYAVAARRPWKDVLEEFLAFGPVMYHLCDGFFTVTDAHEHLGAGEFDLPYLVSLMDREKCVSLETKKDNPDSLDDFVRDIRKLREYAGN